MPKDSKRSKEPSLGISSQHTGRSYLIFLLKEELMGCSPKKTMTHDKHEPKHLWSDDIPISWDISEDKLSGTGVASGSPRFSYFGVMFQLKGEHHRFV